MQLAANPLPGVPLVESPLFAELLESQDWDAETRRVATSLNRDGFAVIDFPDPEIDALAEGIRTRLTPRFDWSEWRERGWAAERGLRVQDAWKFDEAVARIAGNQSVLDLLTTIYGRRAWPFQTLNFPVGTQQHYHSDSIHFSSIPERFMCGVWVALEDIDEDCGPVIYYPGSHRWPILYNDKIGLRVDAPGASPRQDIYHDAWEAMVAVEGLEPRYLVIRQGQALIWAANLLHGGSKQKDPTRTRWSQVTHYYFDGCCYFTPMLSDPLIGNLYLRRMTDISTGREMPNMYMDLRLDTLPVHEALNAKSATLPEDFDPETYLRLNPDVRAAKVDPAAHYLSHGRSERRLYR